MHPFHLLSLFNASLVQSAFLSCIFKSVPYRSWWLGGSSSHVSWYVQNSCYLPIKVCDWTPWTFGRILEGSALLLRVSTKFLRAPICSWGSPFDFFCPVFSRIYRWLAVKICIEEFTWIQSLLCMNPVTLCGLPHSEFLIGGAPSLWRSIILRDCPTHLARACTVVKSVFSARYLGLLSLVYWV